MSATLLLSSPLSATSYQLRATFFVLAWIAERIPHLVREIASRGHEVASHGYSHRMCSPLPDAELKEDLDKKQTRPGGHSR